MRMESSEGIWTNMDRYIYSSYNSAEGVTLTLSGTGSNDITKMMVKTRIQGSDFELYKKVDGGGTEASMSVDDWEAFVFGTDQRKDR